MPVIGVWYSRFHMYINISWINLYFFFLYLVNTYRIYLSWEHRNFFSYIYWTFVQLWPNFYVSDLLHPLHSISIVQNKCCHWKSLFTPFLMHFDNSELICVEKVNKIFVRAKLRCRWEGKRRYRAPYQPPGQPQHIWKKLKTFHHFKNNYLLIQCELSFRKSTICVIVMNYINNLSVI